MNVVKKLWSGFYCNSAMPQKTIETYFQTLSKVKQPMKEVNSSESTSVSSEPTCKKLKLSPDKENSCDPATDEKRIPLTPEQKSKIAVNKIKAQVKLQSKTSFALHENIGTGWFAALKEEFSKTYFEKLSNFLAAERSKSTVYPPPHQVYSWTHYCDIKDVKVVILGQDPYHGVGQAHGLCFSVPRGIAPPPSLVNMYKELEKDIPGFKHPGHGYLVGWAKQGVLLLNACLTVRAHNANSHKDHGWEMLTDAVIKAVSTHNRNVVFLLWGSYAQKKASVVDKKKHHLLNAPHPSPLSAHRGFFGCGHFSKCNELLIKNGKTPIDWCNLPILED